jgi:hypothetical protein
MSGVDWRTASPGRPGNLKFKCELWANCPIYERVQQDQAFIFSPETLMYAPQELRNRIVTIPGVDGAYLRVIPQFYIHNFISFIDPDAPKEAPDPGKEATKSRDNGPYSWDNVIPLSQLMFLSLVPTDLTANYLRTLDYKAVESSAIAAHQTWISDGSLFCSDNVLPTEYDSIQKIEEDFVRVRKAFCTKWDYRWENVGQSVAVTFVNTEDFNPENDTTQNKRVEQNTIVVPSTDGISHAGDPIQVMKDNNVESIFQISENMYGSFGGNGGINPGMHWRLLKRTPIFQGEDFSIEFSTKAPASTNIGSTNAKFRMLEKFKYLDVYSTNSSVVCGALGADGLLDQSRNNKIIENTRKIFDFSRQVYYIIEIGVNHPDHNYWIIIAENSFPIFCHVGVTPTLQCSVKESFNYQNPPPARETDSDEVQPCRTGADETQSSRDVDLGGQLKEVTVAKLALSPVLRKLSTYDAASSATLLGMEKLKVTVRQHAGHIVVTFAGFENNPWVISRKDIDPAKTPISIELPDADGGTTSYDVPVNESQVSYKTVQMLIPFAQIAIMGGNRKCGFSFAPVIYNQLFDFLMPQPFSIQGPVNADEVEFLWRDKGKSLDPSVSVNLEKQQYTNEAGTYTEICVDPKKPSEKAKSRDTWAIDVQKEFVLNYGKAPDMMKNDMAASYGALPSNLTVSATECTISQGSTSENSKLMQATISVLPGGYMFPAIDDPNGVPWVLQDCVTPLIYTLRLFVPPKGCIFRKTPVDVSQHVLSFNDEWSETDWQKLEHSGSISFLVSDGMKFRNNQSNYLNKLIDKTFYLQVSIWWENGIMETPSDPRDRIVFTGLCHGGTITTETNKRVLDCKMIDYSKILKDQFFMNSPFFDRMRDVNAVRDIIQLAGLRDGTDNDSSFEPGSLIRVLANSESKGGWYNFFFNGDKIYNREYALPGSYDMLQSPFMRFADGSSYWDAIEKMAGLSNKVAFFDRLGVFHFNPLPYDQEMWGGQSGSQTNWTIQDWAALSKVDFFATPKQLNIDGSDCPELNRQIIGDYKIERVVQDVMNEIKVITTTPNGEILVAGHTNYASLNDPDSPGFLGYKKPFLQMDGIFGSEDTVKWVVKNYTRMFIPPIKVSFKAIGRNNIKALDVVTFQPLGSREKQPLIVTSVKSEVDASKNTWYQDFECLWLFPRQDIQWGNTNEIGLGLDGSISGNIGG